ncbi:putative membrane protein [Saccharomonospora marina XMU15]|uniref:Putative membrane protein n=1 Tax=Saccharomonospora marina XMU15 TaxID=882083 RepID=H5WYF3_9PSEU|nr:DoxX family protein [Saccharomonospora marina]EHR49544.1 putative membrane protein [Saccharomonospora marina XMU15]
MNTRDDELDQRTTRLRSDQFDGSGFTPEENPPFEDRLSDDEDEPNRWHGGLDFGLLILRLALGGTIGAHGLQKLFGLFDGPGIGGFADALGEFGYTSQTTLLAWITGIAEVGGGALLILGLFTPLGAAAVLGVTASAVYVKFSGGYFLGQGQGFEYEVMLSAVAFALLFTGSGRVALDKNTPWRRKPLAFGIVALLLAAAAVAVVIVLFR